MKTIALLLLLTMALNSNANDYAYQVLSRNYQSIVGQGLGSNEVWMLKFSDIDLKKKYALVELYTSDIPLTIPHLDSNHQSYKDYSQLNWKLFGSFELPLDQADNVSLLRNSLALKSEKLIMYPSLTSRFKLATQLLLQFNPRTYQLDFVTLSVSQVLPFNFLKSDAYKQIQKIEMLVPEKPSERLFAISCQSIFYVY